MMEHSLGVPVVFELFFIFDSFTFSAEVPVSINEYRRGQYIGKNVFLFYIVFILDIHNCFLKVFIDYLVRRVSLVIAYTAPSQVHSLYIFRLYVA